MEQTEEKRQRQTQLRRNAIVFNNFPSFQLCKPQDRPDAAKAYRIHDDIIRGMPAGVLHRQIAGVQEGSPLPRHATTILVEAYCNRSNVSIDTLKESITRCNGVVGLPGLFSRRQTDDKEVVNLCKLDDETLYRLYCTIPETHRPICAHKLPIEETRGRPPKKQKAKALGKLAPEVIEAFVWVCCDKCEKWRRLFNTTESEVPQSWQCIDHPDEINCETSEDAMDEDEKWDGEVRGTTFRVSFRDGQVSGACVVPTEIPDTSQPESEVEPEAEEAAPRGDFCMAGAADSTAQSEDDEDGNVQNLFGDEDDDDDDF